MTVVAIDRKWLIGFGVAAIAVAVIMVAQGLSGNTNSGISNGAVASLLLGIALLVTARSRPVVPSDNEPSDDTTKALDELLDGPEALAPSPPDNSAEMARLEEDLRHAQMEILAGHIRLGAFVAACKHVQERCELANTDRKWLAEQVAAFFGREFKIDELSYEAVAVFIDENGAAFLELCNAVNGLRNISLTAKEESGYQTACVLSIVCEFTAVRPAQTSDFGMLIREGLQSQHPVVHSVAAFSIAYLEHRGQANREELTQLGEALLAWLEDLTTKPAFSRVAVCFAVSRLRKRMQPEIDSVPGAEPWVRCLQMVRRVLSHDFFRDVFAASPAWSEQWRSAVAQTIAVFGEELLGEGHETASSWTIARLEEIPWAEATAVQGFSPYERSILHAVVALFGPDKLAEILEARAEGILPAQIPANLYDRLDLLASGSPNLVIETQRNRGIAVALLVMAPRTLRAEWVSPGNDAEIWMVDTACAVPGDALSDTEKMAQAALRTHLQHAPATESADAAEASDPVKLQTMPAVPGQSAPAKPTVTQPDTEPGGSAPA